MGRLNDHKANSNSKSTTSLRLKLPSMTCDMNLFQKKSNIIRWVCVVLLQLSCAVRWQNACVLSSSKKKNTNKNTYKQTGIPECAAVPLLWAHSKTFPQISRLVVKKKSGVVIRSSASSGRNLSKEMSLSVYKVHVPVCVLSRLQLGVKSRFSPCSCHCTFDSGLPHEPQREANDDS